jgi:hypothetical protein
MAGAEGRGDRRESMKRGESGRKRGRMVRDDRMGVRTGLPAQPPACYHEIRGLSL